MRFTAYSDQKEAVFGIKIRSCGHIFAKCGREISRPEGRDDWLLFYVAKEHETFFLESEVEAPAGSFIIFRPGEKQHHIYRGNKTAEFYYIHFETEDISFSELESSKMYRIEPSSEISGIFEEIINDIQLKRPCHEKLSVFKFLQIMGILERKALWGDDTHGKYLNEIEMVVQKINRDYFENVSLDEYARMCRMSKYHFLRVFENVTGMTPISYRNRIRLERAKELLKDTNLSVHDIGARVGYTSQSYFCDAFKKEVGVSPANYRKVKK